MNVDEKFNRSSKVKLVKVRTFQVQTQFNPLHSIKLRLYEAPKSDATGNTLGELKIHMTPQEALELAEALVQTARTVMRAARWGGETQQ